MTTFLAIHAPHKPLTNNQYNSSTNNKKDISWKR